MKKLLSFILVVIIFYGCHDIHELDTDIPKSRAKSEDSFATRAAGSMDYYYGSDGKIPIIKSTDKSYVLFKSEPAKSVSADKVTFHDVQEYCLITNSDKTGENVYSSLKSGTGKIADIERTKQFDEVIYAAPYYSFNAGGKEYPLTNVFYVELKSPEDIDKLRKIATDNNVTVGNKIPLTDNAYVLSCTKESSGNALEMANMFYETGAFLSSTPEFLSVEFESMNDTYFSNQWNLKNTGQYGGTTGIDINLCNAHTLTTGSNNITVAVIDQGVPTNHPDLNIFRHHDAVSMQNISTIYGDHGVACTGIINARTNNSEGIAGIAPGCKLMSISTNLSTASLVYALYCAADNGARIISNSWGSSADLPTVNTAIKYALDMGCIVVFSAGNSDNPYINYPKAADPNIIVVGAASFNGQRKSRNTPDGEYLWGSNYGTALDVIAPGVLIPTTDIQESDGYNPTMPIHLLNGGTVISNDFSNVDYTVWFKGTSSACPHVSGIAALMLSVNPNLTRQQVSDIIERTARKVGGYSYSTTSDRPNGKWNNEMGYGLVDACAAVRAACAAYFGSTPAITETSPASRNYNCTYYVSSPPSNVTFNGWTITPSTYTITGGTNSTTLKIVFNDYGQYTLTANYTLPGGVNYPLTTTVNVIDMHVERPELAVEYYSTVSIPGLFHVNAPRLLRGHGEPPNDEPEPEESLSLRIYITNPQSDVSYQWSTDRVATTADPTSLSYYFTISTYQYILPGTVYCRARFGNKVSAWSRPVYILGSEYDDAGPEEEDEEDPDAPDDDDYHDEDNGEGPPPEEDPAP